MRDAFVIGIAGGSGSGKSTFSERIVECFANDVAYISCDNYYYPHDDINIKMRDNLNYDSPDSIEFSLMTEQVRKLKAGEDIYSPVYDFTLHTRSNEKRLVKSKPIIILDGILLFAIAELRDIIDLKIYIEADADERILRRVKRDVYHRGRDLDGIIQQYLETVKPMHNQYVEPTKAYADIIINGGKNDVAFDVVKTNIEKILSR